eukprot:1177128-Prorocentrum_minimum.AAC.2
MTGRAPGYTPQNEHKVITDQPVYDTPTFGRTRLPTTSPTVSPAETPTAAPTEIDTQRCYAALCYAVDSDADDDRYPA